MSPLAIAATVAVVVFSIFLGVFGPRIGNRPGISVGVSLSDLALAVESRHGERLVNTIHAPPHDPLPIETVQAIVENALHRTVELPALGTDGHWVGGNAVQLPGGRAAVLFAQYEGGRYGEYVTICIFNDEDRFTVFDPFGRPIGLPDGEAFVIEPPSDFGGTTVVIWREDSLVWVIAGAEHPILETLRSTLQARVHGLSLVREVQENPTP